MPRLKDQKVWAPIFVKPPKGFPSKISLFAQDWDVVYCEQIDREEYLLGACEVETRTIYIDANQSESCMRDTLFHECVHCMFRLMPLDYTEEEEEGLVTAFTTFALSLLRENPEFWRE